MAQDRIRADHLLHLIEQCGLKDDDPQKAILRLQAVSAAHRQTVLAFLDTTLKKDTSDRLRRLWTPYGSFALFLYEAIGLQHLTAADLPSYIARIVGAGHVVPGGQWYQPPESSPADEGGDIEDDDLVKERILALAISGNHLLLRVRMIRIHRFVYEDEEKETPFTYDISIAIDFSSPMKLAQVYGAQVDGRKAMMAALKFLLPLQTIPQRKPGSERFLLPVKFSETQIKTMASSYGFELVGMVGADSQGVIGKIGYEGMATDVIGRLEPLDMNDPRVIEQDAHPQEQRTYNFSFTHSNDGFKEVSRVEFGFQKRHQKLSFPARATRPAMERVIQAVYAAAKT